MVAKPSNHGMTNENTSDGVIKSSTDPKIPPKTDNMIKRKNLDFGTSLNSFANPKAPLKYPGNTATALVAFAAIVGTPVNTKAGKVKKTSSPCNRIYDPCEKRSKY
jgi:hypothetical protein